MNKAPGPKGTPISGNLWSFWLDFFKLLDKGHEQYGDVVRYRMFNKVYHLLTAPEDIKYVLITNKENFSRNRAQSSKLMQDITGNSVLTMDGDPWQQRRRLCAPAFSKNSLTSYRKPIEVCTKSLIEKWKGEERINIEKAMSSLTANVAGTVFFGNSTSWDDVKFEKSIKDILHHHWQRIKSPMDIVHKLPLKSRRGFDEGLSYVHSIVQDIMDADRDIDASTLLGRLIAAKEDGLSLSVNDIKNEIVTFLLAGHETSATLMTWAFYLLAEHPEWQEIIAAEAKACLNSGNSSLNMPKTLNFIQETVRLYPSIWLIERQVINDDEIGGFDIPKDSTIIISSLTTHRDKKYWDEPNTFNPDRFKKPPVKNAYFPFGMGPHICIGQNFSLLECQLMLGHILQHYRFEHATGTFEPEYQVGITLRMKKPLILKLKKS